MNRHLLLHLPSRRHRSNPGPPRPPRPLLHLLRPLRPLRPRHQPDPPLPQNHSGFPMPVLSARHLAPLPNSKTLLLSPLEFRQTDLSGEIRFSSAAPSDRTRSDLDNRIYQTPASGCWCHRIPEAFRAPLMQRWDVVCIQ